MRSIPTPIVNTVIIAVFVLNAREHKSKGIFLFVIFSYIIEGIFLSDVSEVVDAYVCFIKLCFMFYRIMCLWIRPVNDLKI